MKVQDTTPAWRRGEETREDGLREDEWGYKHKQDPRAHW
jgi:hypothetical protein